MDDSMTKYEETCFAVMSTENKDEYSIAFVGSPHKVIRQAVNGLIYCIKKKGMEDRFIKMLLAEYIGEALSGYNDRFSEKPVSDAVKTAVEEPIECKEENNTVAKNEEEKNEYELDIRDCE